MRRAGVRTLQSQADWTNHDLLRFFAAAGFRAGAAARLAARRGEPLDEPSEEVDEESRTDG